MDPDGNVNAFRNEAEARRKVLNWMRQLPDVFDFDADRGWCLTQIDQIIAGKVEMCELIPGGST